MDKAERHDENPDRTESTAETADHIGGPGSGEGGGGSSDVILGTGSAGGDGTRIGPYRLLEKLGEGGMGVVYLAEQTEPIHRRVAIKVIKPGMDSRAVIARFEAERQALEKMDHANIAKILDAGVTDRQLPYFVMEYVKGVPITEHADHERLDVEERLDLFIQVCEAVQHAHHKGIIHRDLKPSNILVAWEETRPVPKVIDFGVARATDQSGNEPAFTRHGQLIGTPEYMSPEQAEMGAQDIDTRTDVYALGVVLYELLTGVLPFESSTLRQVGIDAVRQIIREVDPPLPSRRLRSLPIDGHSTLGTVSKARRTDSKRLARLLRNDLDWVVMKCLEKRRDRRYATPSALALDLRRFLSGDTVLTGPPSLSYHVGKFVRRHRAGVVSTALVGAAMVVGLVVSVVLLQRALRSEADTRALAIAAITEFHDNVAHLPGALEARKAFVALGLEYLDEARARARGDTDLQLTIADAYDKLGDVCAGLRTPHVGDLEEAMSLHAQARAIRHAVQARRPADPRVILGLAHSALVEGDVLRERERNTEAAAAYQAGLERLDGLESDAKKSKNALTERALLLVARAHALGRDRQTRDSPERLSLHEEAVRLTRALVQDVWDDETTESLARALNNLGEYLVDAGRAGEALGELEESAGIRRQLFSADPTNSVRRRDLAASTFMLGSALIQLERAQEGRRQLEESLVHFQFLVAADPDDIEARERLAQVYERMGASAPNALAKIEAFRIAVTHSRRLVGDAPTIEHRGMLATHTYLLARWLMESEQYEEGASSAEHAFARYTDLARDAPSPRTLELLVATASIHIRCLDRMRGAAPGPAGETADLVRERYAHLRDRLDELLEWMNDQESLDRADARVSAALKKVREKRDQCESRLAALSQAP